MKYISYLIVPACFVLLCGCSSKEESSKSSVKEEVPVIDVEVVSSRPVTHSRAYTANVEAFNVNNIAPSIANRIKEIKVDVGDCVAKGQELVILDNANADQLRVNLEYTESEYNRAVELLNIGSGTQRAVDQLKAQLEAQRVQYRNTLENTKLVSPISGVVTARNYDPGDMCGGQPILTIGQISPAVKLIINVNETDLSVVKNGMSVDVEFDAFAGEKFSGRVSRISPAVDVLTRTFPVEVTVNNQSGKIRPGMFARVNFDLGTVDNVVVPDRAVMKQSGSAVKYVYRYSNGKVEFRRVELGQRLDDSYELLSGIEDGDTVVIAGQAVLTDGVSAEIK